MSGVSMSTAPPPDEYRELFTGYMAGGLQASLARVGGSDDVPSEADRQQAWHTLSYALDVDQLWPLACELLLLLAPKLEQAGFREAWLAFLMRGVQAARLYRDHRATAELAYHAGMICRYLSRYDEAYALLSESAAIAARLGQPALQGRTLNQLAYVEYERSHHLAAEQFAQQALELESLPDMERAMSKGILGLVASEENRHEKAIAVHREALDIRRRLGDRRTMAWSLQNIGNAYRRQGILDEAILYLSEAAEILERLGDTYHHAIVLLNLGSSYNEMGQPEDAKKPLIWAERTFQRLGATKLLANTNVSLGNNFLDQGDIAEAINRFALAAQQFAQIESAGDELNAKYGLAYAYMQSGEYRAAEAILEEIDARLPSIAGIPFHYDFLSTALPEQLAEVRRASAQ
jgi:tetratricopeptide (TPR) repeat protein